MFLFAGKRFNIYASDTINGVTYPNFTDPNLQAQLGITEVPDPEPPVDYTPETHYVTELDEEPYIAYTPKSPELISSTRWEQLKNIRDELTDTGGVLVQGKWFHTDVKSKIQILGLLNLGQNVPANLNWKTMDGTFALMTPLLAQQIFAAQIAREPVIFAVAEMKKLDTSPVSEGWPARYVPPEPEVPPEEEEPPVEPEPVP